jgi:Phosphotransferase enzyme family
MSTHEDVVLLGHLRDHAAVRAWRAIKNGARPTSVEVLKPEKESTAVFRLNGAGPAGASVIAKRRTRGELDLEHSLYAQVLPSLSVPTLQIFGFVENADDHSWIFLEDAGELWYAPASPEHRALAIRWLADLHTRSSDVSALMPDTGSEYFRSVLDGAHDSVRTGLAHSGLSQVDAAILRSIASHLEVTGDHWDDVEAACAAAPRGLVHGDFVPKNVRVRMGRDGLEIVAFDWEWAGLASPAADLGLLPEDGESLRRYHELVSEAWPELSWPDVQRLARMGRLLRLLNCVHWEGGSFRFQWIEHSVRRMRAYEHALREHVESRGWAAQ